MDRIIGNQRQFLQDLSPIFALTVFLFVFSTFMGFSMGEQISPDIFEDLFSNIPDPTQSTVIEMFIAILLNNTVASFLFLISGVLIGLPPLLFIIMNGFIVGWISYNAAKEIGLAFVLLTLLPHGLIEIPAISLSASMGVGIGYKIINKLRKQNGVTAYIKESMRLFIFKIIPLLILAAGIETGLIAVFS
jgi:stage II sporulation protein M